MKRDNFKVDVVTIELSVLVTILETSGLVFCAYSFLVSSARRLRIQPPGCIKVNEQEMREAM
jgi:hypothetical protein